MPASLKQSVLVNGVEVENKDIKVKAIVEWECDSIRCAARHGETVKLSWDQTETDKDPSKYPEDFFKTIMIHPNPLDVEEVVAFCSAQCVKDYLTYMYITPKGPKQILEGLKADQKQQELPFDEKVYTKEALGDLA